MPDLCKVEVRGFNEFELGKYDILLVIYAPARKKEPIKVFALNCVAQSGANLLYVVLQSRL